MAVTSAKNFALSPAAVDLGLGDQLTGQLEESVEEQRKKRLMAAKLQQQTQGIGGTMAGGAAADLGLGGYPLA